MSDVPSAALERHGVVSLPRIVCVSGRTGVTALVHLANGARVVLDVGGPAWHPVLWDDLDGGPTRPRADLAIVLSPTRPVRDETIAREDPWRRTAPGRPAGAIIDELWLAPTGRPDVSGPERWRQEARRRLALARRTPPEGRAPGDRVRLLGLDATGDDAVVPRVRPGRIVPVPGPGRDDIGVRVADGGDGAGPVVEVRIAAQGRPDAALVVLTGGASSWAVPAPDRSPSARLTWDLLLTGGPPAESWGRCQRTGGLIVGPAGTALYRIVAFRVTRNGPQADDLDALHDRLAHAVVSALVTMPRRYGEPRRDASAAPSGSLLGRA